MNFGIFVQLNEKHPNGSSATFLYNLHNVRRARDLTCAREKGNFMNENIAPYNLVSAVPEDQPEDQDAAGLSYDQVVFLIDVLYSCLNKSEFYVLMKDDESVKDRQSDIQAELIILIKFFEDMISEE